MKRLFILFTALALALSSHAQEETTFKISNYIQNDLLRTNVEQNLFLMFQTFQQAVIDGKAPVMPKKGFTKDAIKDINELWANSEFTCPVPSVEELLIENRGINGWEMRNIPVEMLAFETNSEQELVVSFDKNGTVCGIDVGMADKVYQHIISENSNPEDLAHRQMIVNFVDMFRTAYNKKNLTYLKQVYSDDALIITGRIVKTKQKSLEQQSVYGEAIELVREDKASYMNRLQKIFANSKGINVEFSNIEVAKHPNRKDMYGVTLRQNWTTQKYNNSEYSDDGFLFLIIDFRDETHPEIHVRTWQPAIKNGRELPKEEIFGFGSFNI